MKRPKRISEAKYGLFHGPLRIEVEEVTSRHKKGCSHCEELPLERRLKIVEGSGRGAKTEIYCMDCGYDWLIDHKTELGRALDRLRTGDGCIRMRRDA